MKTFPSPSSQPIRGSRKKRSRQSSSREMHQIAHHLFNQLSVINLCSFKLHARHRDATDEVVLDDLKLLQRAAEEATQWAERLSQIISQAVPPEEDRKPAAIKTADSTNNVVPLFAPVRQQR